MTRTRVAAVAVLTLAFAIPAAGCGEDDGADQFREDYNAAVDRLSRVNTNVGQAAGGAARRSNAAIAKEFRGIAHTAEETRNNLANLDPPEDAKEEFDSLLTALDKGVSALEAVSRAARRSDKQGGDRAVESLSKSWQEITEAETALRRAVDG